MDWPKQNKESDFDAFLKREHHKRFWLWVKQSLFLLVMVAPCIFIGIIIMFGLEEMFHLQWLSQFVGTISALCLIVYLSTRKWIDKMFKEIE